MKKRFNVSFTLNKENISAKIKECCIEDIDLLDSNFCSEYRFIWIDGLGSWSISENRFVDTFVFDQKTSQNTTLTFNSNNKNIDELGFDLNLTCYPFSKKEKNITLFHFPLIELIKVFRHAEKKNGRFYPFKKHFLDKGYINPWEEVSEILFNKYKYQNLVKDYSDFVVDSTEPLLHFKNDYIRVNILEASKFEKHTGLIQALFDYF